MVFAELLITVSASVCEYNRGAGRLISGARSNAINNFLHVLRGINEFSLTGDTIMNRQNCRGSIAQYLHLKGVLDNNGIMWNLHCWEPAECTLVDYSDARGILQLEPKQFLSLNSLRRNQVDTVFLPIDGHNVISYTFLPYVNQMSIFFSTAMLSGCSVFIATPNNINCNIVVMHSNRFCGRADPEDDDDNHKQAMFVLEQVHSTNQQCRYQIQRRWASDQKRANIERYNYHYNNNIVYYRQRLSFNFLYGYNLGGSNRRWQFCAKEIGPSPLPEICNEVRLEID